MKDYTQENYDRLCAALTMDELANFMDCIPFRYLSEGIRMQLKERYLSPSMSLDFTMIWLYTPQGHEYWSSVRDRLREDEV